MPTDEEVAERYNEVVRASAAAGYSILHELEEDLVSAWMIHDSRPDTPDQRAVVRGRIRGLAQAIALIRSPYTRREMGPTSAAWGRVIRAQEDEGHARARARQKAPGEPRQTT